MTNLKKNITSYVSPASIILIVNANYNTGKLIGLFWLRTPAGGGGPF
jgi:hypothetical protein